MVFVLKVALGVMLGLAGLLVVLAVLNAAAERLMETIEDRQRWRAISKSTKNSADISKDRYIRIRLDPEVLRRRKRFWTILCSVWYVFILVSYSFSSDPRPGTVLLVGIVLPVLSALAIEAICRGRTLRHEEEKIDRAEIARINRAALTRLPAILARWLPGGRIEGAEYVARNPLRADHWPGRLKINLETGQWADFAVRGACGRDVVSLAAYLGGIGQIEAANRLAAMLDGR
jgi:hypothetical protein